MRAVLGVALVAVMGLVSGAGVAGQDKDEKIDGKKLIGKWAPKEGGTEKFVVEFTKDGKLKFVGEGKTVDGTYKLEGNKLTIEAEVDGKKEKMVRTISKLTDTELTSKDEDRGKEDTLVRV